MKRLIVLGLAILGAIAGIAVYRGLSRSTPIASRGGRVMSVAAYATPHYMQTDARWGSDLLGTTVERLAASGCTVCCLSMALARYDIHIEPGELNRRIVGRSGFTPHGWLKWSMVDVMSGGRLRAATPSSPEYDDIDEAVERRWPVLAKIRLEGHVPHWVMIAGKDGEEYLARDPLVDGRLVRLSERSRTIESVRIIHPAD